MTRLIAIWSLRRGALVPAVELDERNQVLAEITATEARAAELRALARRNERAIGEAAADEMTGKAWR